MDEKGNPVVADSVTITDVFPEGTTYVENSASHPATVTDKQIQWVFTNVPAGANGVVSFSVHVNASAKLDKDGVPSVENVAKIEVNNDSKVDVSWTNKPVVKLATGDLTLSKTVTGYSGAPKTFTLNLHEIGDDLKGDYKLVSNKNRASDIVTFDKGKAQLTIESDEVVTIQKLPVGAIISVTEVMTGLQGFTPTYTINGVASSLPEGRVTIAKESAVTVAVSNAYVPEGAKFELKGVKTLNTSTALEDTTFGFIAQSCNAQGVVDSNPTVLTGEATVSSTNKEAQIAFSPITYTEAGTYYYLIQEIDGGLTGVTYDNTQYLLIVVVADNNNGALQASATLTAREGNTGVFGNTSTNGAYTDTAVAFVNSYAPLDTQLTLEATKVMEGRTLEAGRYSFEVVDASGNVVSTGTNDKDGKVTFRPITYSAVTTNDIVYTIREVNGGLHGVEYSAATYTVTVKVVDDAGQLKATATYPAGGAVFTNKYTPDGIQVNLAANKSLVDGKGNPVTMQGGEFHFVAKDKATDKVVATATNAADGTITFAPIGYTVADKDKTFTYVISEVIPDLGADPYMDYDGNSFEVTVKVTYDSEHGTLDKVVTYPATGVTFENIKYPSSIDVFPAATKTTSVPTGSTSQIPGDATFSFTVINVGVTPNVEAATGVGAANGTVNFSKLSFSEAGTYRYVIKESHSGEHHGITYDSASYLMEVVISKTNGKLEVDSVTYYSKDSAGNYTVKLADGTVPTFRNTYNAKGQIAVTAKKVLNDLTLKDGDFAFRLVREGTTNEVAGVVAANGTITFANMYYDLSEFAEGQTTKTIHYVMSEVIPAVAKIPGVTYDETKHDVYITISHDPNDAQGKITAKVTDASGNALKDASGADMTDEKETNVVFTNSYAPVEGTQAVITAKKELTGRTLQAGEFSFNLYHKTADGKERLVDTATNAADGSITFTRHYPAGVLNGADSIETSYVIREVNNSLGGIKYDEAGYPVYVKIVDDKDGTISCEVKYSNNTTTSDIVFKNEYEAADTSYKPEAKKVLKNRKLLANEFSFVVQKKDGSNWLTVSTGTNDVQGKVEFSPIGFEEAGTYIFRVSEVAGHLTGVTYDNTVYYLKVVVTDNQDGTMTANGTYHKAEDCTDAATIAAFENIYTPASISVQLQASKTLTGRDMVKGEFSFVVKDKDGKVVATGGNEAAVLDSEGKATAPVIFSNFGGYTIADAGKTYKYTITEQNTNQSGVTFSNAEYEATVKITNNTETGILEAAVSYAAPSENHSVVMPSFNNAYQAAPAKLQIPTDKTLINKAIAADEFTFTLTGEGKTLTAKNDANGVVAFEELEFTKEGTYKFVVSEAVTNAAKKDQYTLDNPVQVVVTVTDDQKGQLHATATYHDFVNGQYDATVNLGGVEFINYYTAPALTMDLDAKINAVKDVKSSVKELPENVKAGYKFLVMDITNKEISSGVSDKAGAIDFKEFTFDKAGEYHYWIFEDKEDSANIRPGVQLDATVWELHILVGYNENNADLKDMEGNAVAIGDLFISDVHTHKFSRAIDEEIEDAVVFNNIYDPAGTTLHLTAKKTLIGRELKDREFAFYLMEGDTIAAEGFNDVNGNIRFTVNYKAKDIGTHNYKVVELQGSVPGVIYDTKEYAAVTVKVADDQTTGKLVASVGGTALTDGATVATGVTVSNDYIAEGNVAVVKANKVLSGKSMKAEEFAFQLVNTADDKDVHKATNTADGAVSFQIKIDKAGVTTYKLSEVKGTDTNMTYDAKVYTVTITATDDGMGNLVMDVAYDTEDGKAPTFTNTYTPSAVAVKLAGEKILNGRDMTAEEFKFEVRDSSGALIALGTNDAKGALIFNEINFSVAGTYTLTVSETTGTAANVTYDTTKFQVVVEVTNADGKLVAEVTYPAGGIKFVNTYEKPEEPTEAPTEKPTEKPANPAVPDTGDHSNVSLFMVLAVVSLGACVVLVMLLKKKKD